MLVVPSGTLSRLRHHHHGRCASFGPAVCVRDRRIRSHQTSIVEGNHFARRFCVEYSAGMQRTLRTLMLLSIFCATPVAVAENVPTAKPEAVGLSSARLERLAAAIRAEVDRGKMPGAVVAIARHGKLAYYESFGYLDKQTNTPMPKDAIFA